MTASIDPGPMGLPLLFVKLSNRHESRKLVLDPLIESYADVGGRWYCEVVASDGIKATRDLELPSDLSTAEFYAKADGMCEPARANRMARAANRQDPDGKELHDPHLIKALTWYSGDDLTTSAGLEVLELSQDALGTIYRFDGSEAERAFVKLTSPAGACITSVLPGDMLRIGSVATPDGALPTIEIVPHWNAATAYWSFLRNKQSEAAEAVAEHLLKQVGSSSEPEVRAEAYVAAAAHATLRFPWLRERETGIGDLLGSMSGRLVDLAVLEWARSFDQDPADDSVFDDRLTNLLLRLDEEPPAYTETVSVLFDRLGTAVDIRERILDRPDEVARAAIRRLRKLADATLPGRERLTYEGEAPLRPERKPAKTIEVQEEASPSPI